MEASRRLTKMTMFVVDVGLFEGRIIIRVKVVKAEDVIAATLKGEED